MNNEEYNSRMDLFIQLLKNSDQLPENINHKQVQRDMDRLIELSRRHRRIEVGICNGEYSRDKVTNKLYQLERDITLLVNYAGVTEKTMKGSLGAHPTNSISIKFGGDPRGATVHLFLPVTRAANNWGGDWGIW